MAMAQKKPQKQFDLIVVGSGLSGLWVAHHAKKQGLQVALIEAQEVTGGFQHPASTPFEAPMDNSLRFTPSTPENRHLIKAFSTALEGALVCSEHSSQVVTYEDGRIRDFLGFGKLTPEFYEELLPFLSPEELMLNKKWFEAADLLKHGLDGALFAQHLGSELVIENNQVMGVMINGHHFWQSPKVVFAGAIADLGTFLPASHLSARLHNHLKRPKLWTLVAVDFFHSSLVTDDGRLHILNGTTQDDIGPCVGRFSPPAPKSQGGCLQISQWLSFVADEDADDSANIGAIIKKIKRQIKRAYPESFQGFTQERIVVIPSGAGQFEDTQVKDGCLLKGIEGLWLASSHLSPSKGMMKPLDQGIRVCQSLGLIEAPAPIEAPLEL